MCECALRPLRLRPVNPQPDDCILLQVEFDLAAFPLSLQTTPAAVRSGCIEKYLKKNAAASLAKGRLPSFGQQRILSVILDAEVDAEVDLMGRIASKAGPTGEGRHRSYEQHGPFQNSGSVLGAIRGDLPLPMVATKDVGRLAEERLCTLTVVLRVDGGAMAGQR